MRAVSTEGRGRVGWRGWGGSAGLLNKAVALKREGVMRGLLGSRGGAHPRYNSAPTKLLLSWPPSSTDLLEWAGFH